VEVLGGLSPYRLETSTAEFLFCDITIPGVDQGEEPFGHAGRVLGCCWDDLTKHRLRQFFELVEIRIPELLTRYPALNSHPGHVLADCSDPALPATRLPLLFMAISLNMRWGDTGTIRRTTIAFESNRSNGHSGQTDDDRPRPFARENSH